MADFFKCYSLILLLINIHCVEFASACQVVHPSEYVYKSNSVTTSEANCETYPSNSEDGGIDYTHCDGTQLKLTDSDLGSEQYNSGDYYVWNTVSSIGRLLFIFQTRVNLTTIALHYYSDNDKGLPRLRFFAVPDDFEVWTAQTGSNRLVDIDAVLPGGEPAGRRNISVNVDFMNVKKVLLYKFSGSIILAASEVEFFTCIRILQDKATDKIHSTTTETTPLGSNISTVTATPSDSDETSTNAANLGSTGGQATTTNRTEKKQEEYGDTAARDIIIVVGIGIAIAIMTLLCLTAIVVVVFLRKSAQRNAKYDSPYSTLCRESTQQTQSQTVHTSSDLYDQIQLSPSTGQAEFISRNETANTNNPPPHQTEYGIHPSVDKDKPKSAKLKITASTISTQDEDKSTSEQPTYAVINKKKKQKTEKESVNCQSKDIAAVSQNEGVTEQNAVEHGNYLQEKQDSPDTTTQFPSQTTDSLQELYTAVKKKPHASTAGDDEEAPQIPPHTIEELYTAVQKKPKANATVDEEEAPPIPAHTVEELYTAVVKKPKVSRAEDEEKAPPVPPYTMEDL